MSKYEKVREYVQESYEKSNFNIAHWMWENHVQTVAEKALQFCAEFKGKADYAVAGALLHDFGDAFIYRHDPEHGAVTNREAERVLRMSGYTETEVTEVLDVVMKDHGCKNGVYPRTVEGEILATADAYVHLTSDFYLQFAWMNIPQNSTYAVFIQWAQEKIERDYRDKIRFESVRMSLQERYRALKEVFRQC